MRAQEFTEEDWKEEGADDVHPDYDHFIDPPFDGSLLRLPVYHASPAKFEMFERQTHGIFVSQYYDYAKLHYGSNVIPLYVDVQNPYKGKPTDSYVDAAFDRDYKTLAKWLKKFESEGYDAAPMFGDGSSIILIGDVPIVHAVTGKPM